MKLFKSKKSKEKTLPSILVQSNPFNAYHSNGTLEFSSLSDEIFYKGYTILMSFQRDVINAIKPEDFNSDFKNELEKTIHDACIFEKRIPVSPLINGSEKKEFENDFVLVKVCAGKYYTSDRISENKYKFKTYAKVSLWTKTPDGENRRISGVIHIENNEIKLMYFNDTDGSVYLRIVSAIASEYSSITKEIKEQVNGLNAKEDVFQMPEHFSKMVDIINKFNDEGVTTDD